jgi:cytidylate kinase
MKYSVALDGPSGSGKSTVAALLAERLGLVHIDTGAMYRAVTFLCLSKGVDPKNEKASVALLPQADIELTVDGKVMMNGTDISKEIRSNPVSDNVSYIASYKDIRLFLVDKQREMAKNLSVVMDGRDIGTYVLPEADVKIYQVASAETRAERRYKENCEKGINSSYDEVLANLRKRDYIDSHRSFAPLRPAPDAVTLDTSDLTIEEAVQACIEIIREKLAEKNIII